MTPMKEHHERRASALETVTFANSNGPTNEM